MSMMSYVNAPSPSTPSFLDDDKPLWRYVTKLGRVGKGGGNFEFQCNFCQRVFKGSYTRVKAHLLQIKNVGVSRCLKVTRDNVVEFYRLLEEAKSANNVQPLPFGASVGATSFNEEQEDHDSKKRKASGSGTGIDNALVKAIDFEAREHLDSLIAKMFYSAGLPFQLAMNPYFISSISFAARENIPGYVPPTYDMLRTTLLQKERESMDKLLRPIRESWKEKGVSIVSDGWNEFQERPVINFMAVSDSMPMFLKAVNTSEEMKDKCFIASLMKEVIMEVGPQNVVQVITYNNPNCKAAGELIESEFPHISWTPCVVHTLNLALESICSGKNREDNSSIEECAWITNIVENVLVIKHYITNHSMCSDMYKNYKPLKLFLVADTRFASSVVVLKRFKLMKQSLVEMVFSDNWWERYRKEDIRKAKFLKDKVTDSDWWGQIDYILSFTAPIYDMLRACDTDKPTLHLVYDMWDTMIEKVKMAIYKYEKKQLQDDCIFYDVVYQILVNRWNKNNTQLHCLAHSLNPRYYSNEWLDEDQNRIPPHKDEEVTLERNKCFKKYFDDQEKRTKAFTEYAKFSTKVGPFAESDSIQDRWHMDPHSWWVVYGAFAPTLQNLALKLLVQPSSSSCCEKNWTTYSLIQSLKRSNLATQRAEDLVFVHNNLRLLSRRSPQYLQGESKMWDIAGDKFGSLDNVGILEFADLSLDEPELEATFLEDNAYEGQYDAQEDLVEVGST